MATKNQKFVVRERVNIVEERCYEVWAPSAEHVAGLWEELTEAPKPSVTYLVKEETVWTQIEDAEGQNVTSWPN